MEIWNAPVGHRVDLGEMPGLPGDPAAAGLDLVRGALNRVMRYLNTPPGAPEPGHPSPNQPSTGQHPNDQHSDDQHSDDRQPRWPQLESLSWHGVGPASGPLRLDLRVTDRSDAWVLFRLHGVDQRGQDRVVADLRYRRDTAAGPHGTATGPHGTATKPHGTATGPHGTATGPRGTVAGPHGIRGGTTLAEPVRAGDRIRRSYPIQAHMLTHHIPDAPGVLMTPNLIALMEETAADIVRPRLVPGAAAVGTWIGVRHTGAAMAGQVLDVDAVVIRTEGRRVTFDVHARVGDRRVGDGQVGFTLLGPARPVAPPPQPVAPPPQPRHH